MVNCGAFDCRWWRTSTPRSRVETAVGGGRHSPPNQRFDLWLATASTPRSPVVADATRFVIPLVVNGRVYFGTRSEIEVYGLLK